MKNTYAWPKRKFGNLHYELTRSNFTKEDAQKFVEELRHGGMKARVTKVKNGLFNIWSYG